MVEVYGRRWCVVRISDQRRCQRPLRYARWTTSCVCAMVEDEFVVREGKEERMRRKSGRGRFSHATDPAQLTSGPIPCLTPCVDFPLQNNMILAKMVKNRRHDHVYIANTTENMHRTLHESFPSFPVSRMHHTIPSFES